MSCAKPSASERACRAALAAALTVLAALPARADPPQLPPPAQPHAQACAQAYPPPAMPADMPDLAASYRVTFTAPGQPARQQVWRLRRSATELVWDMGEASTDIWRRGLMLIALSRTCLMSSHVSSWTKPT